MTEFVDRYCMAQDRAKKWAGCLSMMHVIRKMILAGRGVENGALEEALVAFDLLSNLSRASSDIHGATVWLARDRDTGKFLVVKQYAHAIDEWGLPQSALRQLYCSCRLLQSQLETNKRIRCLQEILDVQISEHMTFLVFRYYPLMFDQVFPAHRHQDPVFTLNVIHELLDAVNTMHESGIAHRDIKVQNIAFDKHSHVVLIDFDSGTQGLDRISYTRPVCTMFTRPPEHFADQKDAPYNAFAGDWWSIGCVIAQLFLVGQILFEVKSNGYESEFLKDIHQFCAEFDRCFLANSTSSTNTRVKALMRASMPQSMRALLHGLLHLDPQVRIAASKLYIEEQL